MSNCVAAATVVIVVVLEQYIVLQANAGLLSISYGEEPSVAVSNELRLASINVLEPDDANYEILRFSDNLRHDRYPRVIVLPETTEQVAMAVKYARANNLTVCIRSGGHSYEGFSTCDHGILVDLRNLTYFQFNDANQTVTFSPFVRLGQLYHRLWADGRNRTVPAGSCHNIGIGGHVLGGGVGYRSRLHGLTSDSLLELEMVTADGTVITANENENPDLFWACQGAGGGQFGVVTRMTLETHPATSATWFTVYFNASQLQQAFKWFDTHSSVAPANFAASLRVHPTSDCVKIHGHFSGTAEEFKDYYLSSGIEEIGEKTYEKIETVDYIDSILDGAGLERGNPELLKTDKIPKLYYKHTSAFCYGPLRNETIQLFRRRFWEQTPRVSDGISTFLSFFALGGAVANISSEATAFPHRNATCLMQLGLYYEPLTSARRKKVLNRWLKWQQNVLAALKLDLRGAYRNYEDADLKDFMHDYYGANADRLMDVKSKYDPSNVFKFAQSITVR